MKVLPKPLQFEWDQGNTAKNQEKHSVLPQEAEEAFFDPQHVMLKDRLHSRAGEERYIIIGKTRSSRLLFVVFTIRKRSVRVISVRDLNRREKPLYEKKAA